MDFESSNWSCVLDQKTSLVWEVKGEIEGLQYTMNTYTWFDGDTGRKNNMYSKNCYWGEGCNTQSFVDEINEAQLCTYTQTGALPSRDELKTIINYYADDEILVDLGFFPKYPDGYLLDIHDSQRQPFASIRNSILFWGLYSQRKVLRYIHSTCTQC